MLDGDGLLDCLYSDRLLNLLYFLIDDLRGSRLSLSSLVGCEMRCGGGSVGEVDG